jgi:hypothetical protein
VVLANVTRRLGAQSGSLWMIKDIAAIAHRPMTSGRLGEWIASQILDIELQPSTVAAAIDGHSRSGPLQGHSVNIKWYLKREGLLDTSESD